MKRLKNIAQHIHIGQSLPGLAGIGAVAAGVGGMVQMFAGTGGLFAGMFVAGLFLLLIDSRM